MPSISTARRDWLDSGPARQLDGKRNGAPRGAVLFSSCPAVQRILVMRQTVDVGSNRLDLIVGQWRRTAATRAHRNLVRGILDLIRGHAARDQVDEALERAVDV